MPPLPIVTDAWQIVVHGEAPAAQIWENVFGYDAGDVTLGQEQADALSSVFADFYDAVLQSDQFTATGITVTDLRTLDGPQFDSTEGFPIVGGTGADPLPLQTCALISWGTSHRGRSFRGRTYLTGFTESDSDGAHIESASHTTISDAAGALLAAVPNLGVISRYSGVDPDTHAPIPRDPGIVSVITSQVTHDLWKTQRRRAPRG